MKLLLAVDIADWLRKTETNRRPFDIETEARALLERHPEAHVSVDDIIATMRSELRGGPSWERPPPR
ncbi:hypothetical protein NO932_03215 [Pelagibacterium sp. 26DY04]|uniref:hypothetical protein n=1 Tax=unclassified Pelagibacterium TaxID=2623280 RepID=UPI00281596BB|nr:MULTISPECIES: hypothetical protein [unclassified Pelagibacterium]WMT87632.1 hypothetical protein NO932_03215 [Pelagibacterium sp. 26DY04]WMT91599.1 hypothetical protein NO934_04885 [Pelagibacterium sp. H642]